MAEIQEILNKTMSEVKGKKKPIFLVAAVAVGGVAIFEFIKSKNSKTAESADSNATLAAPTALDSYPQASMTSDDYTNMLNQFEAQVQDTFNQSLNDKISQIDKSNTDYFDNVKKYVDDATENMRKISDDTTDKTTAKVDAIQKKLDSANDTISTLQNKANTADIVRQMQENSEMYANTTDPATRSRLSAQNNVLGNSIGAVRDDASGTWWTSSGQRLYTSAAERAQENNLTSTSGIYVPNMSVNRNPAPTTTSSSTSVGFSSGTDYAAEINKATQSGASQDVINHLNAQREEKITSDNLDNTGHSNSSSSYYDPSKDYAAAINNAKAQGASSATINRLQQERQNKITGMNLNNDGTKRS